jgi:hypothetical protein
MLAAIVGFFAGGLLFLATHGGRPSPEMAGWVEVAIASAVAGYLQYLYDHHIRHDPY